VSETLRLINGEHGEIISSGNGQSQRDHLSGVPII
jgi:hypothetical protein